MNKIFEASNKILSIIGKKKELPEIKIGENNSDQNIETLSKILSIIGKKKELPERKIGENNSKIHLSLIAINIK